jgi:multicomponent Na+:H+ antiporter subunit A
MGKTMALVAAVLIGFVAGLAAPLLTRRLRGAAGWLLALLPAGLAAYFLTLLPAAAAGRPPGVRLAWVPDLGVELALRADGLALLLALLVSGVGALVLGYAGGYLAGHPDLGRFYGWLLSFMAAMLGVALADNLLALYVFWELTSLSSYGLIGFEHEREEARAAALQALLVTGAGGLALLAGFVLLGLAGGSFAISSLNAARDVVQASPLYPAALGLILLGAFTKSAHLPFHFWLPNAMEAPTPVSAYLHSATMVKAGVYLLARLQPALGGSALWLYAVGGVGAATMLVGGFLALPQTDVKRLLAYSTVSALGALTLLIGLGSPLALTAAMATLLAHALYKGALFLVAGALDHEAGTRDVRQLGGLWRAMPLTAAAAALAALSMAGLPPFFGFISKELLYESALAHGAPVAAAAMAASLCFVAIAGVAGMAPFWGAAPANPRRLHEAPVSLWLGPLLLAGLGALLGVFPAPLGAVIGPAAAAAMGRPVEPALALWHGITPAFLLSLATLSAGIWLYLQRRWLQCQAGRLAWRWGPSQLYAAALAALTAVAASQTRVLQHGYLRYYLLTVLLVPLALGAVVLLAGGGAWMAVQSLWAFAEVEAHFYELALAGMVVIAAAAATRARSSLAAVAALGIVGYGVALLYLLFGAPDLAVTQVLVESLTVILFVLAFYHLPEFAQLSPRRTRLRDAAVALSAGALMAVLVLLAAAIQLQPSISAYFLDNALPLAHGRNVVNVILVDFRALDTLGEIAVLGIAAVGIYALLKLRGEQRA